MGWYISRWLRMSGDVRLSRKVLSHESFLKELKYLLLKSWRWKLRAMDGNRP